MDIKYIYERKNKFINKEIEVSGWIRFNRPSKNIGFIELTDGTKLNGIQLVYKINNEKVFNILSKAPLFSSLVIKGILINGRNKIELLVNEIIELNETEEDFPIGKKEHGLEFLREQAHLRIKTKMFQAIMKIRSTASLSIHEFFHEQNFFYVHSPILTGNDAEGAGESFEVFSKDNKNFFDKKVTLTVSGQLHAEGYAQALKKVYTFGPTFRAENSHTTRHASEFWMVEPEAAFCDYHEIMDIGWKLIVFIINKILIEHREELELLEIINDENLIKYLEDISNLDVKKISYREALIILEEAIKEGVKFEENKIEFGIDLSTEHEKFISGKHFKSPVYIFDYPKEIKSFYMYDNQDGTVRGFDLLIPKIGELIGGSQREDRYSVLMEIIKEKGQDLSELDWYINLRKNGYAKSSGFGLGFERLIMFLTSTDNIRDVIPFPRTPGKLRF